MSIPNYTTDIRLGIVLCVLTALLGTMAGYLAGYSEARGACVCADGRKQ